MLQSSGGLSLKGELFKTSINIQISFNQNLYEWSFNERKILILKCFLQSEQTFKFSKAEGSLPPADDVIAYNDRVKYS